jgi:hypothetical protein
MSGIKLKSPQSIRLCDLGKAFTTDEKKVKYTCLVELRWSIRNSDEKVSTLVWNYSWLIMYPITEYIYLCIDLSVGDWLLHMTQRLIIDYICDKYLQNTFIYEEVIDRTQNIPNNRLC